MNNLIAVYGTLKKGNHNHYLLNGSKYLGKEVINGFLMYSLGGFPCVVKNNNKSIHCEIYEVDDKTLSNIYRLEGYSGERNSSENWYDTVDVETKFGLAELFYFKNEPRNNYGIISDGIWK